MQLSMPGNQESFLLNLLCPSEDTTFIDEKPEPKHPQTFEAWVIPSADVSLLHKPTFVPRKLRSSSKITKKSKFLKQGQSLRTENSSKIR